MSGAGFHTASSPTNSMLQRFRRTLPNLQPTSMLSPCALSECHLNTSDDRVVESCLEQPYHLGRTLACSTRHYDGWPMARPDAI